MSVQGISGQAPTAGASGSDQSQALQQLEQKRQQVEQELRKLEQSNSDEAKAKAQKLQKQLANIEKQIQSIQQGNSPVKAESAPPEKEPRMDKYVGGRETGEENPAGLYRLSVDESGHRRIEVDKPTEQPAPSAAEVLTSAEGEAADPPALLHALAGNPDDLSPPDPREKENQQAEASVRKP